MPLPAAAGGKAEEFAEDIGKVHAVPIGHAASTVYARMTKLVIGAALVGIRKHGVGFVDFLEFFLCIRFFIDVRMILARQCAKRGF